MQCEFIQQHHTLTARPAFTRLDAAIASEFMRACKHRLSDCSHLVIDLGRIEFIDSAGIGALVAVLKGLGEAGRVTLVAPARSVRTVFQMTRLDQVFHLVDHEAQVAA